MTRARSTSESRSTFESLYGRAPEVTGRAPGRVNLLGEHTDYQGGFVLPAAIPQQATVSIGKNGGDVHRLHSANLNQTLTLPLGEVGTGFAPYLTGSIALAGVHDGLDVWVWSDVPAGGLSSSAALELATLRALRELYVLPLDDVDLALLGQKVEHEYVGVMCGIMDQMASSLADTTHMLFLDTRSLERQKLPMPAGTHDQTAQLLVIDSGVPRRLAESGYNERRLQVEEASRLLGVNQLRDVQDVAQLHLLPDLLLRRARHVVSENARVLEALSADAAHFGHLMNLSHASLQGDYEVSHPLVDVLVRLLQGHPQVYGARMTGAGFGGAVVGLVQQEQAAKVAAEVLPEYRAETGTEGRMVVP